MTDAGVLYHFKTKHALVLAVLERFDLSIEHDLRSTGTRGVDLIRATREWGAAMEALPELQSMLIVLSAEHLHDRGPARDYVTRRYVRLIDRYRQAFADGVVDGDLRDDLDPAHEASALIAHLDGIRLQWFLLDRSISMADSVRTHVDQTLTRLAARA